MKIFQETLTRSTVILFIGVFIALLGINSFTTMPRSLFPEINYPRVVVEVNMGFAPLEVMEWGITSALEKQLRAVPGVRMVKSTSSRGLSSIDVFLNENEDVSLAVQRVNAKIGEARTLIPATAKITVRPISAAAFPAAEYCFISKTKDSRVLRTFVEYTIKPLILVIPGIFNVQIIGGDQPEFSVELDPKKLALRNLNIADIDDRLRNSNSVDFIGPIETKDAEILAFGGQFVHTPKEIENIVVDSSLGRSVRISDLGRIQLKNEWKTKHISLSGTESVCLNVFYQSGIDQKVTSTQVAKTIADIVSKNPGDSYRSWDLNDFTDAATNAVLIDLCVGMFIISLITLFFLRNFRYSLIALLIMPLAAGITFLVMSRLGYSINLMTLGGLTAAIGLVVDNTVILLEMYHHKKSVETDKTEFTLLLETLSAVSKPMMFGTVTIVLVFIPISFLSGVSGMFFGPMAAVANSALIISVLLSLFIVPGLVLLFERHRKKTHKMEQDFEQSKIAKFYRRILSWGLNRSKFTTLFFLIVPLLGVFVLHLAQTGFLPEWDEGDLVVDFRSTTPISLSQTVEKIKPIEEYLKNIPELNFFVRKIGTGLGQVDAVAYQGEIIVKLKQKRKRTVFEIIDEINNKAVKQAANFEFDLFQILPDRLNDLSGTSKPIVLYIHGDDEIKMDEAAIIFKKALSKIKGLASVRILEPDKSPEILFALDEQLSRALDLNPTVVNENVKFGLFSLDSSAVQIGAQTIPIRLRSSEQSKNTTLESVYIYTSKGGLEKVGKLGKVEVIKNRIEASHIDGSSVRTITAELSGADLGGAIVEIKKVLQANPIKGIDVVLAGDYEKQQQSFKELMYAFLAGLILIFLTSLLFSNRMSVALPLTMCSLVPPIAGLVGCILFHIPLDVSSFSGLISVTGIAVANSFMAFSAIESLPDYYEHFNESIIKGMVSRLRPILMTNLAAMAGFVPIAIGLAQGDEILRPFSIAIISGLFGAIYTTLMLVPLFYKNFARRKHSFVN